MKKKIFISLFLFQVLSLFAQSTEDFNFHLYLQSKLKHSVEEWDVSKLKKDTSVLLIDVRSKEEFDVSHLNNSMNFPYKKFKTEQISHISKEKKIVLYCSVGYRSEKVAEKLNRAGYTNTINLYGGIFEWVNRGFPIYDSNQNLTDKIHAYSHSWGIWLEKGVKVYE